MAHIVGMVEYILEEMYFPTTWRAYKHSGQVVLIGKLKFSSDSRIHGRLVVEIRNGIDTGRSDLEIVRYDTSQQ